MTLRRTWAGIQFTYFRNAPLPDGQIVHGYWKSESGVILFCQRAFTDPLAPNWEIWVPNEAHSHSCGFCPEDALMNAGVVERKRN